MEASIKQVPEAETIREELFAVVEDTISLWEKRAEALSEAERLFVLTTLVRCKKYFARDKLRDEVRAMEQSLSEKEKSVYAKELVKMVLGLGRPPAFSLGVANLIMASDEAKLEVLEGILDARTEEV